MKVFEIHSEVGCENLSLFIDKNSFVLCILKMYVLEDWNFLPTLETERNLLSFLNCF